MKDDKVYRKMKIIKLEKCVIDINDKIGCLKYKEQIKIYKINVQIFLKSDERKCQNKEIVNCDI